MASLSSIEYEERRNKDKSLFSRMLKVVVSLEAGEGSIDLAHPISKLIGLEVDHVIMFVSDKLNEDPCPPFVTADKVNDKPMRDPNLGLDIVGKNGRTPAAPMPPAPTPDKPVSQDLIDRGWNMANPEQRKEMERLSAMHGTEAPRNELGSAAEYDAATKRWNICPACKSADIDHKNADGRTWQGCSKDKIFLNADGTVKPMKPKGA